MTWAATGRARSSCVAAVAVLSPEDLEALVSRAVAKVVARPAPLSGEGHVLTRQDVAKLLKVHPNVVSKYVRTRGLPARQVGKEWRFLRPEVLAWVESRERVQPKGDG